MLPPCACCVAGVIRARKDGSSFSASPMLVCARASTWPWPTTVTGDGDSKPSRTMREPVTTIAWLESVSSSACWAKAPLDASASALSATLMAKRAVRDAVYREGSIRNPLSKVARVAKPVILLLMISITSGFAFVYRAF